MRKMPRSIGSKLSSNGCIPACSRGLRVAGRSVHAHLIDLVARGIVESDGPPALDAHYRIARN
jgi:hypothetical protein